jgi:hypothetical protein
MNTPSIKSKWQTEIVRSGLGQGPVGVGMVMSTYANADGTGVHPSMRTVAEGMGCSRGYVERHCAALVEHDRLATVAKAIPGHRGTEYRLTFGRTETSGQVLQSEALEVSAKCSNQDDQVLQSEPQVLQSEPQVLQSDPASAPTASITMVRHHEEHHDLNHEEHHGPTAEPTGEVHPGCTHIGKHAWCGIEPETEADMIRRTKAAAEARAMAEAPDF